MQSSLGEASKLSDNPFDSFAGLLSALLALVERWSLWKCEWGICMIWVERNLLCACLSERHLVSRCWGKVGFEWQKYPRSKVLRGQSLFFKVMWWVPIIKSFAFRGSALQIPSLYRPSKPNSTLASSNSSCVKVPSSTRSQLILVHTRNENLWLLQVGLKFSIATGDLLTCFDLSGLVM